MKVRGKNIQTVRMQGSVVSYVEQNLLPFRFKIARATRYRMTCEAIRSMAVRGAGAIGVAAGFAAAQAFLEAPKNNLWKFVLKARKQIEDTRPTAQNLFGAVTEVYTAAGKSKTPVKAALKKAQDLYTQDIRACRRIGRYGSRLIKNGARVQTHCNAGWLAFVDHGTALSPVYEAVLRGKKVFVWVDETRPRNQGARLTAWELGSAGIPHAVIADNAAASLMAQGKIDLVIVGADRIARNGDTANKIGTLEKAICAKAFGIPFYVAAPSSTFDPACPSGRHIPIEERSPDEVLWQSGLTKKGRLQTIRVAAPGSAAVNPAFDVTPARYITGIITEKGIFKPSLACRSLLKDKSRQPSLRREDAL